MRNFITALLISLTLAFYGVMHVYAAGITVNSPADNATGGDGQCTLREAIANANSNSETTSGDCVAGSGIDTISFNLPADSTITLASSQLSLADRLIIDGSAAPNLRVSGNNASRVFDIQSSAIITMQNLSVVSGTLIGDNGGGIRLLSDARQQCPLDH
jgi:CSLREA domain-containing protein